jgi:hypothetical protein
MRDLMLKLLTYEPFEEITGEEEKFIDTVLKNTVTVYITMLYYDLMHAFMNYIANPQGNQALALWYTTYFTINTNAAQSYLCYAQNGKRAYYPTLFKKICFYCTTELGLKDGEFLGQIGIRENLMYKWEISSRYRRILNSDSYKRIRVFRNGRKVEYLTKVVKAAYYEASRQEAGVTYFDPGQKGHNSPRKWQFVNLL